MAGPKHWFPYWQECDAPSSWHPRFLPLETWFERTLDQWYSELDWQPTILDFHKYYFVFKKYCLELTHIFCQGMGIYHLRPIEGHQERMDPFQLLMKEFLLPALKPLSNVGTNLIWLNQFPMLPDQKRFFVEWYTFYSYKDGSRLYFFIFLFKYRNGEITSETVQQVNIVIRKLLKYAYYNVRVYH